jgi:four helix bundle protein
VWLLADEVRRRVWSLTEDPEISRQPWLQIQLRRSSHSACANIVEGFVRFRPREFARYLEMAKASLAETSEHLRCPAFADPRWHADVKQLQLLSDRAQGAATKLIVYLKKQ